MRRYNLERYHQNKQKSRNNSEMQRKKRQARLHSLVEQSLTVQQDLPSRHGYNFQHSYLQASDLPILIKQINRKKDQINKPKDTNQTQGSSEESDDLENMLSALSLDNNNIESLGCQLIAKQHWSTLKTLKLGNNKIGDQGCQHLMKSQWPFLEQLNLNSNMITAAGCKYLATMCWKRLDTLNMGNNRIMDIGCKELIASEWPSLFLLNLYCNQIQNIGCKYLSKGRWPNMVHLNLCKNEITDHGCQHIVRANFAKLSALHLSSNHISNRGCQYLAHCHHPPNKISLRYHYIEAKAKQYLKHVKEVTYDPQTFGYDYILEWFL